MHKKIALVSLALLMVFAMVTAASAAPKAMANTTQKGSLLIWPKIVVEEPSVENGGVYKDTIIFLSNDYPAQVWVQCYWMDEFQNIEDFNFKLTPNQPIFFSAMFGQNLPFPPFILDPPVTVPPFALDAPDGKVVGALFCWAVTDDDSAPKIFNHLYGNALLVSGEADFTEGLDIDINGTVLYNAYSFVQYAAAADPSVLPLDGLTYDACPSYLLANFTTATAILDVEPSLTLVPCKQDLRQDRLPTYTKAKFDIWNANETKYTGAYQCLKCFVEWELEDTGTVDGPGFPTRWVGFGGDKFTWEALKTVANRFRVYGVPSSVCKFPNTVATGFVGLLLYEDDDFIYAGTTLHGAGLANTAADKGSIAWDVGSASQEGKAK